MGLDRWGGVDASLDGSFDLGAAVAVARARYELITWGKVVDGSLAQSTGGGAGAGAAEEVCTRAKPRVRRVKGESCIVMGLWRQRYRSLLTVG